MKTDIEIARSIRMKRITEVAAETGNWRSGELFFLTFAESCRNTFHE